MSEYPLAKQASKLSDFHACKLTQSPWLRCAEEILLVDTCVSGLANADLMMFYIHDLQLVAS